MDTGVNRDIFIEKLNALIASKREDNSFYLSQEKYTKIISQVISAKIKCSTHLDYRRVKRFDVLKINGEEKLIVPLKPGDTNVVCYITNEELYDILHETHTRTGHGGRTRMLKELQVKYKNVTYEVVMLYINLCKQCQIKHSAPKKGRVKPVVSSNGAVAGEQIGNIKTEQLETVNTWEREEEFKEGGLTKNIETEQFKETANAWETKDEIEEGGHTVNIKTEQLDTANTWETEEEIEDGDHTENHIPREDTEEDLQPTTPCIQIQTGNDLICRKRAATKENLLEGTKMLRVGDDVQVPDVDGGPTDNQNVVVVIGIEGSELYKLANKNDTLKKLCTGDKLLICKGKLLSIDEICFKEAGARGCCHCKRKCSTNKCSCKSKGLLCSSKCHNGLSLICCNK